LANPRERLQGRAAPPAAAAILTPTSGHVLYERIALHPSGFGAVPNSRAVAHFRVWVDGARPHRFRLTSDSPVPRDLCIVSCPYGRPVRREPETGICVGLRLRGVPVSADDRRKTASSRTSGPCTRSPRSCNRRRQRLEGRLQRGLVPRWMMG
jgi:hypothetical protein